MKDPCSERTCDHTIPEEAYRDIVEQYLNDLLEIPGRLDICCIDNIIIATWHWLKPKTYKPLGAKGKCAHEAIDDIVKYLYDMDWDANKV